MSDATFLVRNQHEPITTFNERLSKACSEAAVTSADVHPVPPGFAVALFSEVEQDEKTGKLVPAGPQIRIQVVAMIEQETIKAFNTRLSIECGSRDVTSAELNVVEGLPVVSLYEEVEFDGEDLKPIGDPVQVRVCRIAAKNADEAFKTENYMEKIFESASGAVVDLRVIEQSNKCFALVTYIEAPAETEEDDADVIDAEVVR
jgi:hypothetical protein